MNSRAVLFAALLYLSQSHGAYSAELIAGPLVGHTTSTSTNIWVETDAPAKVKVEYWIEARVHYEDAFPLPIERGSATSTTATESPFTATVEITGLNPGWLLHYIIKIDGRTMRAIAPQVVSLMPPLFPYKKEPKKPAQFSVAFASCMHPAVAPVQPIWLQIPRHRPSAMLFLGDNNYMPSSRKAYETERDEVRFMMAGYHRELRNMPGLRDLVASTPTYAIWDDHDFGPGNSDRTFRWREESLRAFTRFWPNSSAGTSDTPGIFHAFQIADVEFFMLDNRTHRDPNDAPDRRTMLGDGQLEWLKVRLARSTATFKVIANGGTLLMGGPYENWQHFGTERDHFLEWLFGQGISGVLFIAGDWHVGTLNRLYRPEDGYPLYELISSNIAIHAIPFDAPQEPPWDGHHLSAAPVVREFNYGSLAFAGPSGERTVALRIIDEQGRVRIKRTLSENDLRIAP